MALPSKEKAPASQGSEVCLAGLEGRHPCLAGCSMAANALINDSRLCSQNGRVMRPRERKRSEQYK